MEEQAGNARFIEGDALHLPFPDGSLGRRPLPRLLMHSPRIREQLAEIMRVMKPGGILGSRDMDVPASLPHKCRFHLGFSLGDFQRPKVLANRLAGDAQCPGDPTD